MNHTVPNAIGRRVPLAAVAWPPQSRTQPPADPVRSAGAEPDGFRGPALALILTAAFIVVLDFSIVNVALPSIQRELGFSVSAVQWIVTGYAITFGGLLILGGRAADLFGRRRMFTAGLLVFTIASLAGGLARDPVLLVASRVGQGAGAALVAPSALSLITTGYAKGPARNRALGMYGATASIGFVAGQVLGGVLVQFTSWRAVFLVNVPVGALAIVVTPRLLGRGREERTGHKLDGAGAFLITTAVAALVYAISQVVVLGWTAPAFLAASALAVAAAAAFSMVERRHPDPLVRADLLRLPGVRKANTMNLLLGIWNAGEMIVLSVYLQQVLYESPLATGLVVAPQGVMRTPSILAAKHCGTRAAPSTYGLPGLDARQGARGDPYPGLIASGDHPRLGGGVDLELSADELLRLDGS